MQPLYGQFPMIYCFGNEGGGSQRRPAEGRGGAGWRPGRQKNNKHVAPRCRATCLPRRGATGPPTHLAARTPSEMRAMANHIISQLFFFSRVWVPFFVPTVTHCYHFLLVFSFPTRRRRPPFLFSFNFFLNIPSRRCGGGSASPCSRDRLLFAP